MENIFLDTSIFVKENFGSKRLDALFEICKYCNVKLVLSQITVNEIKAQYKKRTKAAIVKHNEVLNDKEGVLRVLKNNAIGKSVFQRLPNIDKLFAEFEGIFDARLRDLNVIILEYPTIDTKEVFDDYFANNPPFNSGIKKHEFPDAITIISLEQWCKKNKKTCVVFSCDKDFLERKSKYFSVRKDFDLYIENNIKRLAPVRTELLSSLFVKDGGHIDSEIKDWAKDQLDNYSIYYEHTNWLDVHDISINDVKVLEKHYEIIALNDEDIEIEIIATVHIKVTLTIDDEDTGIYDSEDKVMRFRETTNLIIENDIEVPLIGRFYIIDANDYDDQCEIVEINEGKELELENDMHDY